METLPDIIPNMVNTNYHFFGWGVSVDKGVLIYFYQKLNISNWTKTKKRNATKLLRMSLVSKIFQRMWNLDFSTFADLEVIGKNKSNEIIGDW